LLYIFVITLRYGVDRRAGGGVSHFGCVFGYGVDRLAADKHLSHQLTSMKLKKVPAVQIVQAVPIVNSAQKAGTIEETVIFL
jgi:hypothetical protein